MVRRLVHAACLALCLGAGACHEPPRPDRVTLLIESPPETLDARMAFSSNAQRIARLIEPGLVTYADDGTVIPDLAERFEAESPTSWIFHLRKGATFHDGSLVTSADVVATYESLLDPALRSPMASKLEALERVEPVGALAVRFVLKRPYAPLLAELSIGILPLAEADPENALAMARHPIGAGPFQVERWDEDEELTLAAFPGYFGGAPRIRTLEVRTVRDETTRVLELLEGRADLAINAVSPQLLPTLEAAPNVRVETVPGTGYAYLLLNLRDPKLQDPRVREALSCALDRAEIARYKFEGTATAATGMLPRTHWAYRPAGLCDGDLAAASRLLEAAGYPDPGGGRPRLTLAFKSSTDRFRKSVAAVIAAQARRAGIALEPRALELGTFLRDVKQGNFQVATLKWSAVIEPDLLRWVYDSRFIPTEANGFEGLNRQGYANPAFDLLVERATGLTGMDPRAALYRQAQQILARDVPDIPLWHEDTVVVRSAALEGFKPSPHGFITGLARAYKIAPARSEAALAPGGAR